MKAPSRCLGVNNRWHRVSGSLQPSSTRGIAKVLACSACLLIASSAIAQDHPPQRMPDPYTDWKWVNKAGSVVSCCNRTDCRPVDYRWQTGRILMPDGEWIDPLEYVAPDGVRPEIYSSDLMPSSYHDKAHACIVGNALRCVGLPGSGV